VLTCPAVLPVPVPRRLRTPSTCSHKNRALIILEEGEQSHQLSPMTTSGTSLCLYSGKRGTRAQPLGHGGLRAGLQSQSSGLHNATATSRTSSPAVRRLSATCPSDRGVDFVGGLQARQGQAGPTGFPEKVCGSSLGWALA
jgi:hypothetical protein